MLMIVELPNAQLILPNQQFVVVRFVFSRACRNVVDDGSAVGHGRIGAKASRTFALGKCLRGKRALVVVIVVARGLVLTHRILTLVSRRFGQGDLPSPRPRKDHIPMTHTSEVYKDGKKPPAAPTQDLQLPHTVVSYISPFDVITGERSPLNRR
jgi:hypothetical protein